MNRMQSRSRYFAARPERDAPASPAGRPGKQRQEMIEMAWVDVPEGAFLFGERKESRQIARPYRIGKYPVTNAQYRAFARATGYRAPLGWHDGDFVPALADHPVTFVSWRDAQAFCAWLSGLLQVLVRLPTEEEWERAARGVDGRAFPWGEHFDAARANVREAGVRATSPVGAFPQGASPTGALDMAGNVWEWTTEAHGGQGALRGGSWMQYGIFARCDARHLEPPGAVLNDAGFRVVAVDAML